MPIDETTLREYERISDELLELQFEGRFLALALALRAFTVNQPRVPAGNPDGGQWVAEGGDIVLVGQNSRRVSTRSIWRRRSGAAATPSCGTSAGATRTC